MVYAPKRSAVDALFVFALSLLFLDVNLPEKEGIALFIRPRRLWRALIDKDGIETRGTCSKSGWVIHAGINSCLPSCSAIT